jgi:hypothetical protein
MISTRWFLLTLPLFLVFALGCSHSKTPSKVFGKVTYKGQPVTAGTVAFHRLGEEQSGSFSFPLKSDGTYSGSCTLAEEMAVTIDTESANPKKVTPKYVQRGGKDPSAAYMEKMKERGHVPAETDKGQYVKIPPKYADKTKSPLRVTLKKGENELNFDLTDN